MWELRLLLEVTSYFQSRPQGTLRRPLCLAPGWSPHCHCTGQGTSRSHWKGSQSASEPKPQQQRRWAGRCPSVLPWLWPLIQDLFLRMINGGNFYCFQEPWASPSHPGHPREPAPPLPTELPPHSIRSSSPELHIALKHYTPWKTSPIQPRRLPQAPPSVRHKLLQLQVTVTPA